LLLINVGCCSSCAQVFGVGIDNPYRIRPFLGAKVPVNSSFSPLIQLYNPHGSVLQVCLPTYLSTHLLGEFVVLNISTLPSFIYDWDPVKIIYCYIELLMCPRKNYFSRNVVESSVYTVHYRVLIVIWIVGI